MSQHPEPTTRPVLTASLTTGVACVARGMRECMSLVEQVLSLDHTEWETTLLVGDVEFHQTPEGPYPDQQMRVSVRPAAGHAALNHTDNNDRTMSIANSYNPRPTAPDIHLIFNGATGSLFPRDAAIPISYARNALNEWLRTRRRPVSIEWRPYDAYS